MTNIPNLEGLQKKEFNIGSIFFNDTYVITNFSEGIDINHNNFESVGNYIKSHFNGRDFGYIANRENSYSINITQANIFNEAFPNLKAYAVVAYNLITERVFEIEDRFFEFNRKSFRSLDSAVEWVEKTLSNIE
ncbi:hypothetical protein AB9K26_10090 [Psychroserpens sp. XS_ASV72]